MTRRKLNNSRRLTFQQLEDRSLMTGNVTVTVQNHSLIITGDSKANDLQIEQSASGQFEITGRNGTTINGKATPQSFTGITKDLKVDLKDGNDKLYIGATDTQNYPTVNIQGNLSVKTGNGDDLAVINANVKGNLDVDAGAGNDYVQLITVKVGNNGGNQNATIQMGTSTASGHDMLDAIDVAIAHDFNIKTGNTSSGLEFYMDSGAKNTVGHDLNLTTGNGADNMAIYNSTIAHKLNVKTNGGDDFLGISFNSIDQIFADFGSGKDYLAATGMTARVANFNGGSGADTVEVADSSVPNHFQSVTFDSFETKLGFVVPMHFVQPVQVTKVGNTED